MSDDQQDEPWGPPLKTAQILEELNKATARHCPICNHDNWQLNSTSSEETEIYKPYGVMTKLSLGDKHYTFSLVPLNCTNCGFVYFVSYPFLARKINGLA